MVFQYLLFAVHIGYVCMFDKRKCTQLNAPYFLFHFFKSTFNYLRLIYALSLRLGMWIIFYFLYIPRRYHRSEPLYLFLLTFIYVYNTLLGLGKYFCFLGKLVLNSNTKGFRALEFFRVKAFDWKISYWTFCCTVLVSILSCLFDSRRRCDKI